MILKNPLDSTRVELFLTRARVQSESSPKSKLDELDRALKVSSKPGSTVSLTVGFELTIFYLDVKRHLDRIFRLMLNYCITCSLVLFNRTHRVTEQSADVKIFSCEILEFLLDKVVTHSNNKNKNIKTITAMM